MGACGERNVTMSTTPITHDDRPTVVVAGLGPAGPEFTTQQVHDALAHASVRFLRTARHPAARPWVEAGVVSFDHHYETSDSFDETYRRIVEDLVQAGVEHGRVVYAVPGSPMVLERTVTDLRADDRVRVEVLSGLSFLDLAWDRLGIDPINAGVRLLNGERFGVDAAIERGPLLISHTWSNLILSEIKLAVDPDPSIHAVLLYHLGLEDEHVQVVPWEDLDRTVRADHLTCLYVPELNRPPAYEIARAQQVVSTLRGACPWDAKQTHRSLVKHLLEETYETIEAIEELGDPPDLAASELLEEELGDVLCQVLFHSTIASEEGLFGLEDVARSLADKLIRRHPHVFPSMNSDVALENPLLDSQTVLADWELQKQQEKGRDSLTDGIPRALPALAYAAKLEKKAATVALGLGGGLPVSPVDQQLDALGLSEERDYGELLLSIARRAADVGIDPETALRNAANRFRRHFVEFEQLVRNAELSLGELDKAARIRFWDQAQA